MDETNRLTQRELKREFELDRHSEDSIAKAFVHLLAIRTPQKLIPIGVQTPSATPSLPHLQETR